MHATAVSSRGCPFCKGAVPPDLVLHGGNCPHCMLEIPGEEAPTDPGLEARQRQAVEDAKDAKKKKRRLAILSVVGVCMLAGAGFGVWRHLQAREADLVYELDDYYSVDEGSLRSAPVQPTPGEATPAPETPRTASRRPRVEAPEVDPASIPSATEGGQVVASSRPTVDRPRPTQDVRITENTNAADGISAPQVEIGVRRASSDGVLQTDDEIKAMAREIVDAYTPQLVACYEQRLKSNESLKGAWKLTLTIGTDGMPAGVKVAAVNSPDADLEACMVRNVRSWKFRKIYDDFTFSKTMRFGSEGW